MKTLFLSALVVFTLSACAQRIPGSNVPSVVQNTLQAKFPNATNPDWDKKKTFYEAEFMMDSTEYTVQIDGSGKLLQYKAAISGADLPATIVASLVKDHPGFTIDDVEKLEKDGVIYYQVELESKGKKDKHFVFAMDGSLATHIAYID
jgi:uncharacterized membrane protein YkoI